MNKGGTAVEKRKGFAILVITCLGMFVCMLDSTIMNITLPAIQQDLGTTIQTSSWMLNVYTMTIAIFVIPMARFADMLGKNKFYIAGLILFGIGSALCGLSNSGSMLIYSRFIQSFGASILIPCSMVIGVAALPIEKRAISLTLLGATQGLSTALGPTVGGLITEYLSWHWVFYVNIPVCIIAVIFSLIVLDVHKELRVKATIDWLGLLFSSLAIFSLNLVLIKGNEWGWSSEYSIISYVIFIISIVLFIIAELKVDQPMINMKLFKNRSFVGATLSVATGFIFLVGVMVLLPQFLTRFQGKSELQAALLITPVSATIFFCSTLAGLVVKKLGFMIPTIIGYVIMGFSFYLLQDLSVDSSTNQIILLCILLGLGFSFVISTATMASAASFEGELLTSSQSVFSMVRQVGVVLAVAIFVSCLTNSMEAKNSIILDYASKQMNRLEVPGDVKEKILQDTKLQIINESPKQTTRPIIEENKREKLIMENVEILLQKMPEEKRAVHRSEITEKVTKQIDEEIEGISRMVINYSTDISRFANQSKSSSFADLYKSSIPFVFICSLIGLVYRRNTIKASSFED